MTINRRAVIQAAAGLAATTLSFPAASQEGEPLFGLIGQMLAAPGKRDELVRYLKDGIGAMPGCLSYVVALDAANSDAIWITEVWDSRESHLASLKLPAVREAIARARPIIAGFPQHFETIPVAGVK